MQDRYDDPTRISRHHAEQDIMVRQWLLHIPWMKKYAESSSLNNKVTRKDEDRDQDGLTIMILRPPKCETVSGQYWQSVKMMNVKLTNLARRDKWRMSSQTDLEKWWMSNRPKSGTWDNGECQNLRQWWMSRASPLATSLLSQGLIAKKYDVNSMSSGVNIKNTMNNPVLKSSIRTFFCKILPPNQKWEKGFWPNIFISFGTGPPHIYKGFTKGKIQKIHYGP